MTVSHPVAWQSTKEQLRCEHTMSCNACIRMRVMAALVDYEEAFGMACG